MKEQLAKKFKREKEMAVKAKQKKEVEAYDNEQRAEKIFNIVESRTRQNQQLEKKKNDEFKASTKKIESVAKRR